MRTELKQKFRRSEVKLHTELKLINLPLRVGVLKGNFILFVQDVNNA